MSILAFLALKPRGLLGRSQHLGGTYCLHVSGPVVVTCSTWADRHGQTLTPFLFTQNILLYITYVSKKKDEERQNNEVKILLKFCTIKIHHK
jgi:hypothetical protein